MQICWGTIAHEQIKNAKMKIFYETWKFMQTKQFCKSTFFYESKSSHCVQISGLWVRHWKKDLNSTPFNTQSGQCVTNQSGSDYKLLAKIYLVKLAN